MNRPDLFSHRLAACCSASFRRGVPAWVALLLTLAFAVLAVTDTAFAETRSLRRQITEEQARAKVRRETLVRLTDRERSLDADLAEAEKQVLAVEEAMSAQEDRLVQLAASDEELQARSLALEKEQEKTQTALADVLRVLWELHARNVGVKGRDMPDWPVTDREHAWSMELFTTLAAYRSKLETQRSDLEGIATRRTALAQEIGERIIALNTEKEKLLQARVRYGQRIAEVRKHRRDTEAELDSILDLVRSLNLRMREAEARGNIAGAKGNLPWPASGVVRVRFNAEATPPVRGLTIGLPGDTPVRAVHWGKVVHNDVLRGIGRVVILMHGQDYYSLYASLSESSLAVGQSVSRGDRIGTSGFVTSLNGPGLYFELRFHQKAINPEQWLERK